MVAEGLSKGKRWRGRPYFLNNSEKGKTKGLRDEKRRSRQKDGKGTLPGKAWGSMDCRAKKTL